MFRLVEPEDLLHDLLIHGHASAGAPAGGIIDAVEEQGGSFSLDAFRVVADVQAVPLFCRDV